MDIIILFALVLVVGIGGFYLVVKIIKLWTGLTTQEAIAKIQAFFSGAPQHTLTTDCGFVEEIWGNVKNVIGESQFKQLQDLSKTQIMQPLLFFGEQSKLPFIGVSIYCTDDNQKQILEHILSNIVKKYLAIYGYSTEAITLWKMRNDLNMPVLIVRYARTPEELRILHILLQQQQANIVTKNSEIVDDTEEECLDE